MLTFQFSNVLISGELAYQLFVQLYSVNDSFEGRDDGFHLFFRIIVDQGYTHHPIILWEA